MKLNYSYFLFIGLVIAILIALTIPLLPDHKWLFLLAESGILIILGLSVRLYRIFISPLNLIAAGIESIREREFSSQFIEVGQPDMDRLIRVYNEMIRRLRDERLQRTEKAVLLEKLIQASPAGIIILDFDGRIDIANPTAAEFLGLTAADVHGLSLSAIQHPLARQLATMNTEGSAVFSVSGIQKYKCRKAHFMDRGFQRQFMVIEELSDEIWQSERNAYGKVIRMMSHEVNNSICAVNSILATVREYCARPAPSSNHEYLTALDVAIDRNQHLNHFMANFAEVIRLPQPRRTTTNLHGVLQSALTLFKPELDRLNIRAELELTTNPLIIDCDYQQMEQVLVNIIRNAIEAIEQNGVITLITQHKPAAQLIIQDTGPGIAPEIRPFLFTPFYTTKKDGQGIGLTLVREILTQHGFRFQMAAAPSGLTQFRIWF